jgi:hypothetical protein
MRRSECVPDAELSRPARSTHRNLLQVVGTKSHGTAASRGIVPARHGWWQACSELGLPGYDALDADGANINLAIGVDAADLVSGRGLASLLSVPDREAGLKRRSSANEARPCRKERDRLRRINAAAAWHPGGQMADPRSRGKQRVC